MRALAVGLLLTSGCNQIFGLHGNVEERDASVIHDLDAAWWSMQLTWQVADGNGTVTFPPIGGASVTVGPIDPAAGPMVNLPVDPATGTFFVPIDLPNAPYRLVYTVDAVPTEIQSTLHTGHFVVPMVGRIDREQTPSHALVEFAPAAVPMNPVPSARILTVGLWTASSMPNGAQINFPFDYDYQQYAVSMAGPQGSLRMDQGDLEIVCALSNGEVTGFATMSVDHLTALSTSPGPSTWMMPLPTTVKWMTPNTAGPTNPVARLIAAVNNGAANPTSTQWGGVIPSAVMPGFVQPTPGGLDLGAFAPLSTNASTFTHTFVNPLANLPNAAPMSYPTAAFVQNTTSRTAGSATLTSGFQGLGLPATPATNVDMHYTVGIAHLTGHDVTLAPEGGAPVVLIGADGAKTVALAGATVVDLTFGTDLPVDDCVATLYKITGATVTPVRRMLLQQPPITSPFRIDASVFAPATTYTLGVVCRKGQTGIATGDYTAVSYPYLTSTLYTPTFTVTL